MKWIKLLLAAALLWHLSAGSWIHIKAQLAQLLISQAWEKSLSTQDIHRPWPWADTWPVAHITLYRDQLNIGSWYVLNGIQGNALAFGPGWMQQSAYPGIAGTTVIAAHRDTQFSVLGRLHIGDNISITTQNNTQIHYTVSETYIIDSHKESLTLDNNANPTLLLVTCYPFDALLPNGPLRYLVKAEQNRNHEVDRHPI